MNSRKTIWLIVAVVALIFVQVGVLGFIVVRSVTANVRAQEQRRQVRRDSQPQFPPPVARPLQSQPSRKTVVASKAQPKVKPTGPRAEPPDFSSTGRFFTNLLNVKLSAKASNAVIRYTLDGSEPHEGAMVYQGPAPIAIMGTTLLRAACFQPGLAPSMSVSHTYTKVDASVSSFQSTLPLVVVNSFNQSVSYMNYNPASFRFIPTQPANGRASILGTADFDGRGDLKRRGYSSLRLPKMSFTLKFRDDDGEKVKAPLFGLPSESDWVLYAPYSDKTLMRDVLGYELSNDMGRYAPRTRLVEVFHQRGRGTLSYGDYAGVYVLVEKIKRGKDRVNIDKLRTNDVTEPNITGGYILKRDHGAQTGGWRGGSAPRPSDDGTGFITPRGLHLFHVEPDEEELAPAQKKWLTQYFSDFEQALYGNNFANPKVGYARYLDVDAFIDFFWLTEMSKNVDAFRYSAFLHIPRGGKITVGPAWDWNLSFGNADYYDGYETSGWYYENLRDTEISWIYRLQQDPEFVQRAADRWAELRRGPLATEKVLGRVDAIRTQLQVAQERNFRKWPIMGREIRPNYYVGNTYEAEVTWMKTWIKDRLAWIDRQYPAAPKLSNQPGAVAAGTKLTLSASSGEIYFTTDGSDPRAAGGGVSASAKKYSEPVLLAGDTKLTARLRRQNRWSAPVGGQFSARQ